MSDRSVPLIDRVTDAFFALDPDWRFTYLNDRAAILLERPRDELIGRVMWNEFPETIETRFPSQFHYAMDKQVPVSFDVYHVPLETWFEVRAYPAETGLSVYLQELTDRKERETELAHHAAAIEAMHDGVVTLDGGHRIVSVNSVIEDVLGVDRETLVGEHVDAITNLAAVADDEAAEIGRAIAEVGSGDADQRSVEVTLENADGERRVTEIRMAPVENRAANVAAIFRDVTEQREYERIVKSLHEVTRWLLESTDPEEICAIAVHAGGDLLDLPIGGIWLLDDEHGYLEPVAGTSDAYEELGGLPRLHPGDGLAWEVFEDGEPARFDDLNEVEGVYNAETPIRSEVIAPIGTHGVLMAGSFEPHRFDETDLDLVATLSENTRAALDRAARERVLRDRTERLERQTDRLEAVATVLSEDLKDELRALAEALEQDRSILWKWIFPFDKKPVSKTLDRAERLIDDVREYARNATAVGLRTRIDLDSVVDAAAAESRLDPEDVVVDSNATLRADPDRFRHLLETVFDAAAARGDGDVTVHVGVLGLDDSGDDSRGFFVEDDATELPPSAHEGALDLTAERDGSADGLGLAVARAIAEAHDWSVSITTGERGGARFEVHDVTTLERA